MKILIDAFNYQQDDIIGIRSIGDHYAGKLVKHQRKRPSNWKILSCYCF